MFRWSPQPDITPFELAQCMSVLISAGARYNAAVKIQREFDKLPPEAKRHWIVLEKDTPKSE